ncbi:MAG: hypothetical protein WC784_00120 [Candidatus Shapirobacteria bacterium]|jgi:hypothetical protein
MAKIKAPEINFQALASYEEYIGLTSTPNTDLIKRLHQNKPIAPTRYTHDGEQVLIENLVSESVPETRKSI